MTPTACKEFASGILSVWTEELDDADFWGKIRNCAGGFTILYFSKQAFSAQDIRRKMAMECPEANYAACSTAGEITPEGVAEGLMLAIVLPASHFSIHPVQIPNITSAGFERIVAQVSEAKHDFFRIIDDDGRSNCFALCLIDGLSTAEETVTAAFHWGLDDIPILGGSAGDDMDFLDTQLILNGEIANNSAILLLARSDIPFRIFKTDNFAPTDTKLVVTRSNPDKRIVYEFNAAPAAEEYARCIGMDVPSLTPMSFASHPLVVRVGGEYYCRSIQKVNPDGSLSFFCAIDDGIVLTVAEPEGMVQTTEMAFETLQRSFGSVDMVIGFDCVLRKVDATNRQVRHKISEIYQKNHVVGFNTYGEQYISMHLNHTFTGIAFGHPGQPDAAQ